MTDTDLAYAAGLMDGEAYIGIKRTSAYKCQDRQTPGYHARIQVRMVDAPSIEWLAATFGGTVHKENARAVKGRPLYCWHVSDRLAADVIRSVLPYLRVKRAVAQVVLDLRALQAEGQKHRTKITGYRNFPNKHGTSRQVANRSFSDEYVALCDALWLRAKALNRVGV